MSWFELTKFGKDWTTGALSKDVHYFGIFRSLKDKVCKGATYFPWTNRVGIRDFIPRSRFIQFYDMTLTGL
jgi:hypothetical protein